MREGSAPGVRGFPIALWKSLPDGFLKRVADLLTLIEKDGSWPHVLLSAYVAMIPKASGGTRPQDQRPITVLDVVYRIWAKGVTMSWAPVLHGEYLGKAAMGFRAQAGTLHVAQLLSDLILLQKRRKKPLWLVSFDVKHCFPSLPWWGLFGVLGESGVDSRLVRCFRSFYVQLRHRFRYGQVEGSEWSMTNGLAQGCPASPDLLNILFEPFHRWAGAQGMGVQTAGFCVASTSFADDVALLGTSLKEIEFLVNAYYLWCHLLGLELNLGKTQFWSLQDPAGTKVKLNLDQGPLELVTAATFRMVGVELGSQEREVTAAHVKPRLAKALLAGRRLAGIPVPTAVAAQMWRMAILPQALYGCEVRSITKGELQSLCLQGRMIVPKKLPLALSRYGAIEMVTGLPLGACAVRDARQEVTTRRLKWLVNLANQPGLVGTVHRSLATSPGPHWVEPTPALAVALEEMKWKLKRNMLSPRGNRWPQLDPEPKYGGSVRLEPSADPCPSGAVWTDGSIKALGGAAALQLSTSQSCLCCFDSPQSSTQCELVALSLVAKFHPFPGLVLTDSVCALQLISSWERRSVGSVLACSERVEVRTFVSQWQGHPHPPILEKVKAHDEHAVAAGNLKSVGNDRVDGLAKEAAAGAGSHYSPDPRFADVVQLQDASGTWIMDVGSAVTGTAWESRRKDATKRRSWLAQLYPDGLELDWKTSVYLFHPPKVMSGRFVHNASPPVLKWIARARSGALATNARKASTGLGMDSAGCPCCDATLEDDAHVVADVLRQALQTVRRQLLSFG